MSFLEVFGEGHERALGIRVLQHSLTSFDASFDDNIQWVLRWVLEVNCS